MGAGARRFLDSMRVYIKSGTGGAGNPATGGVGGDGGSVIFQGRNSLTLAQLEKRHPQRRFSANHGSSSSRRALIGQRGSDLVLSVPTGVELLTDQRRCLGRIDTPGQRVVVARGGRGGCADTRFLGVKGRALSVRIDLRLLADFGFVGFPNAGKSTLMSALSKLAPKVSSYPFTTIRPSVGSAVYADQRSISLADLPGLVEGAHINVGLGHHFLKHVERSASLLFVVDVFGFQLNHNCPNRNAFETVALLNRELELYAPELVQKPALIVLNKIDKSQGRINADEVAQQLENYADFVSSLPQEMRPQQLVKFDEIIPVSAKQRINTDYLKLRLRYWLDQHAAAAAAVELHRAKANLQRDLAADADESVESFV